MKVLYVGEGPQDVGPPAFAQGVRPATGVIPILARRVCPEIDKDSVSIYWREVPVLPASKKRMKGWAAKVRSSIVLAVKNACAGTICVADRDRDDDRLTAMESGAANASTTTNGLHRVVCGGAKESIEAWVLGAPTALAGVLGVEASVIHQHYRVKDVEDFYQKSDKEEKRPKDILAKIAQLKHEASGTQFRETAAERIDVAELERNCTIGFKPFAEKLRAAFGSRP